MGGLSFKRLRLQGKIEGNVHKLRSQREKVQSLSPAPAHSVLAPSERASSPSPPPAPVVTKRRRYMDLIVDEEEEEEPEEVEPPRTRVRKSRLVKKLGDDFDRVAQEKDEPETMPLKTLTRSRRLVKSAEKKTVVETAQKSKPNGKQSASEAEKSPRVRTSPRLAKRVSS